MSKMPPTELVATGEPATALAGLFDPAQVGALTKPERLLLTSLVSADDRVEVTIPDDISSEQLWNAVDLCARVHSRMKKVQGILKILIGRALVVMQTKPDMYESRGFQTFDAFLSDEEKGLPAITGISRSELYNAKRVASKYPTIAMADVREIGFPKMVLLAKVRQQSDSDSRVWIEKAKSESYDDFRETIYRSNNLIERGSLEYDVLTIKCTKSEKEQIEAFWNNKRYQAYLESESPAQMLLFAIENAGVEWDVQIGQAEAITISQEQQT